MIDSNLLLRRVDLSAITIQGFTDKQKLQQEGYHYEFACLIMDHLMEYQVPLSLRSQMCLGIWCGEMC